MIVEPISGDFSIEELKVVVVHRPWGKYRVLTNYGHVKVKELIVDPGKNLSYQRHKFRHESWFVISGTGVLNSEGTDIPLQSLTTINIPAETWHQLINSGTEPLHLVEIQHGSECDEADIERAE
jgi:mannose-6-phosphate isomerase-like protein (cupin superfamily)